MGFDPFVPTPTTAIVAISRLQSPTRGPNHVWPLHHFVPSSKWTKNRCRTVVLYNRTLASLTGHDTTKVPHDDAVKNRGTTIVQVPRSLLICRGDKGRPGRSEMGHPDNADDMTKLTSRQNVSAGSRGARTPSPAPSAVILHFLLIRSGRVSHAGG